MWKEKNGWLDRVGNFPGYSKVGMRIRLEGGWVSVEAIGWV